MSAALGTAAVIGGSGFIGRRVAAGLRDEGWSVTTIGRRPSDSPSHALVDASDHDAVVRHLTANRYDRIVNCAGVIDQRTGPGQYRKMAAELLQPVINLIEAIHALAPGTRFVHLGSNAEYGVAPSPQFPDTAARPTNAYGALKLAATEAVLAKARGEGLVAVVVRPFFVYGPGAPPGNLIEAALEAARTGAAFPTSPGGQTRDMIHVDEVARIVRRAADGAFGWGGVVNACTGRERSIASVLETIRRLEPRFMPDPRALPYRVGEMMRSCGGPASDPRAADELLEGYLRERLGIGAGA